jgi:hypothetical protein
MRHARTRTRRPSGETDTTGRRRGTEACVAQAGGAGWLTAPSRGTGQRDRRRNGATAGRIGGGDATSS